jgi:putative tryptophan/tyrosine transport system substrate-binding protein
MMRRREFIAGLGGTVAWPVAARAQRPAIPVIGALGTPLDAAAFHRGLGEQGYFDGRNAEILYRGAEFRNDRWPALAADLVYRQVAVIAAFGTAQAVAARSATSTIPIVFVTGSDPIELGLVTSLSHPGGNVTGVAFLAKEVTAKRLALLHQIAPEAASIGHLVNQSAPPAAAQIREALMAAQALGVRLVVQNASVPNEIEAAFAYLAAQQVGALLVDASDLFAFERNRIAALASRHALPAIYHTREIVEAGGLMSYAGSLADQLRVFGVYTGRILKGEKPADLPVQQSSKIELVINLKTAKALGLTIPETLLATADEVIQ